jgi:TM2 domain-containing membrane protein YozV
MKKRILSPLLSAFVIPGLGQLVNGQIVKGSLLLGGVTMLFVLAVFKLVHDAMQALQSVPNPQMNREFMNQVMESMARQNHTLLLVLFAIFVALWAYSVVDGYVNGRRADRNAP